MAILNGIKIDGNEEVHQLDYENGIGNKPKLVKSWDDLDGKPFYSEFVTLFEWDGDTTDLEYVEMTLDGVTQPSLYKISDEIHSKEEFIGAIGVADAGGTEQTMEITVEEITQPISDNGNFFSIGDLGYIALEDTTMPVSDTESINISKGTWHVNPELSSSIYVKSIIKENVKQIEEKFIPPIEALPAVTTDDDGKILQVVEGAWTAVTIANAEEGAY